MKNTINQWQKECEQFQNWFASLGGNISSNEQMSEAFKRIEAKGISDNNLYRLIEENEAKQIEVKEPKIL